MKTFIIFWFLCALTAPALAQQFIAIPTGFDQFGYYAFTPTIPVTPTGTCAAKTYNGTCVAKASSSNPGDCAAQPATSPFDDSDTHSCATVAAALALLANKTNRDDWLVLKKGDTFTEGGFQLCTKGMSSSQPFIISAYPVNSAGVRPIYQLTSGPKSGISTNGGASCANQGDLFAVIGIDWYAYTRDPANGSYDVTNVAVEQGLNILNPFTWILIEDNVFRFFVVQNFQTIPLTSPSGTLVVYRNIIENDYDYYLSGFSHSQGTFVDAVSTPIFKQNVFDHNGWNATVPGADATIFNHNCYFETDVGPVTFTGNILANGGDGGCQLHPGGQLIDNLSVNDSTGQFTDQTPSLLAYNVVTEGTNINTNPAATSSSTAASNGVLHVQLASGTCGISGTTLTVDAGPTGIVGIGRSVIMSGVTAGTQVTGYGTGTGGAGTYIVNQSQTITDGTPCGFTLGNIRIGMSVGDTTNSSAIPANSQISAISSTVGGDITISPVNGGIVGAGDVIIFGLQLGDGLLAQSTQNSGTFVNLVATSNAAPGTTALTFASTSTISIAETPVPFDLDNPGAFTTGTRAAITNSTTVTLSMCQNCPGTPIIGSGVASGDRIRFGWATLGGGIITGLNPTNFTSNVITNRTVPDAASNPDYGIKYAGATAGGVASGNVVCKWGSSLPPLYVDNGTNTSSGNTLQVSNCSGIGPDPANATIEAYATSIGLAGTLNAFMNCAKNMSRDNWSTGAFNQLCMAHPADNFFRGKLGVQLN